MISLDTLIPTPSDGLVRARDLLCGDLVFDGHGDMVEITEISITDDVESLEVEFSTPGTLLCSPEQGLMTRSQSQRSRGSDYSTKRLEDIIGTLENNSGVRQHEVPLIARPLDFTKQELPVHPYLLGVLLGDGMLDYSRVLISSPELDMIERLRGMVPEGFVITEDRNDYQWSINRPRGVRDSVLIKRLRELGVYGTKSLNKFVPFIYQMSAVEDRVHLLQGLMDTDGWTGSGRKGSRSQFSSISLSLSTAVVELVLSLGGVCTMRKREYMYDETPTSGKRHNYPMYVVELKTPPKFPPHWLPRKAERYNPPPILKFITGITPSDKQPMISIVTTSTTKSLVVGQYHVIQTLF